MAGDDHKTVYANRPDIYGNLVIIQHNLAGLPQPVFTLYAQLSQVLVKVGDVVGAGQEIGLVGMRGRVKGSTLHFEVRYGENTTSLFAILSSGWYLSRMKLACLRESWPVEL